MIQYAIAVTRATSGLGTADVDRRAGARASLDPSGRACHTSSGARHGATWPSRCAACHHQGVPVVAGAEPFTADGGDVAVLLCHGFTGSPQSLRAWAEHHAGAGLTVRLPRLPGHGTSWQELNRTRWQDWYACVERELLELSASGHRVVVGGMSMGGALGVRLAQQHPTLVQGLVLVNAAVRIDDPRLAALPVLRHVVPSLAAIGDDLKKPGVTEGAYSRTPLHALWSMTRLFATVCADLPMVTAPVLAFRSRVDHVVPASSTAQLLAGIASADVREVVLEDSFHVATMDNDAPAILAGSLEFALRVAAAEVRS